MPESITHSKQLPTFSFVLEGGRMGEYIRSYEWFRSPLGDPITWPQSLKNAINIALSADVAMYIAWGNQFIQFYNDAFQALLGVNNEPLIGARSPATFADAWHIIGPAFNEALGGRPVKLSDLPISANEDGIPFQRFFNVNIAPLTDDRGIPSGVFATVVKSTERQLKNLIRKAPVAIVKYRSADFIVELANDQALAMWGKTFNEVKGKAIKEIFPEVTRDPAIKAYHDTAVQKFLDGETYIVNEQEITFVRNGRLETGYFNYTNEPVRDAEGKVTGVLSVAVEVTDQVRARRRAESAGRELVILAHAMPQLVWIADSNGVVSFYNDRIEKFAGAEKLPDGKWHWHGLLHPDDLDDTSLRWNTAVAQGTVYEKEHRVLMKDGEYRWHLSRAIPITDEQGTVVKWYGTATDIHDIRTSQQRIQQSEERLRFAIESTGAAIFDYNLLTGEIYWSDELKTLCGYPADEIITEEKALAVLHPDDVEMVKRTTAESRVPGTDGHLMIEHRVVNRRDKSVRWLNSRSQTYFEKLDGELRATRVAGIAIDITDRKQTEVALAETTRSLLKERERLEIALRTGQLGAYEWKISEPVVWWSPETYAVFGMDTNDLEITTEIFNNLIHPEDRDELWRKTQQCIDNHEIFTHEYRIVRPDGHIRWVSNMSNVGLDSKGNAERITGVVVDITERKEAELARAQLSAIVESSADAIYSYDFDGTILSWNSSAEILYGYQEHEIAGKSVELLIPDERATEPMEKIMPVIANGGYVRMLETVRKKRDGTLFNALMTASPIRNSKGKIIAVSIIVRDITERKAADERVRYAAALTNSIVDAVIATDLSDYKIVSWNKGAELLYGWKADEVMGKPAANILPTTPLSGKTADWFETLYRDGYWRGEVIQLTRTGRPIRIQSSLAAVKNDKGEITSFVTVNRDVTQVRKIEQELKNAKEQLELTFANTPSAIYRFNKSGVLEYLNHRGAEMLGFDSSEDVLKLSIDEMSAHIEDRFIRLLEDGTLYNLEAGSVYKAFTSGVQSEIVIQMIDRRTNDVQWILTSSTPVKNDSGQLAFVLAVATDITKQKQAEEALRKSEEELERLVAERTKELQRSNEDLQQFAHVASHDLKEPIRKIKTFASRLETEKSEMLDERGKIFLSKIQSAGDRMLKMIEGVLNYSTIGALGSSEFEAIDLNKVMRDIVTDLEVLLHKNNGTVTYNHLPTVHGVPIRIYQLFYNLVINSVKFARTDVAPEIHLHGSVVEKDGRMMAKIVVQDNGIGFEKSQAKMIFDTFTRLHSLDKYEGTGLGLALCKKIVERHGGTIEADGELNKGATFIVQLPLGVNTQE